MQQTIAQAQMMHSQYPTQRERHTVIQLRRNSFLIIFLAVSYFYHFFQVYLNFDNTATSLSMHFLFLHFLIFFHILEEILKKLKEVH